MKKVFILAALVLACTAATEASAMSEAALNASQSELMPVKKTAKKTSSKKTTTKSSTKKTTSAKKTTSTASKVTTAASSATTTASSAAASTASSAANSSSTGSTVANILGGLLGAATGSSSSSSTGSSIINGILNNVIGSGTFSKEDLCHTWKYSKPGCAFTSENLLAKAGGEVAASKIEDKLATYYSKIGFTSSNTYFTFNTDGSFNAKIDGKSWNGTYTFDEKTHAIQLKGLLLLSMSGYATKTTNGISLLFEQKKLLNLIKTLSAFKGSSTLSAVGSIANSYDGVRIGFEMSK